MGKGTNVTFATCTDDIVIICAFFGGYFISVIRTDTYGKIGKKFLSLITSKNFLIGEKSKGAS